MEDIKVAVIGTNGLLSNYIGFYCEESKFSISWFGLEPPALFKGSSFYKINLLNDDLDYEALSKYDFIIYACGAGIQSNLSESTNLIYGLNTFIPIQIMEQLSLVNFTGSFVTFGSYFEIGSNDNDISFNESDVLNSRLAVPNHYSISKRLLSTFSVSHSYKFSHFHYILPTIYGPLESCHRLIPYTINALRNGDTLQFTSGIQLRQYVYVGDIPKIIFSNERSGIYNIGGSEIYSVKEIVEKIHNMFGVVMNSSIFGKLNRVDVGMKNLKLNDSKLLSALNNSFEYTAVDEIIKLY